MSAILRATFRLKRNVNEEPAAVTGLLMMSLESANAGV